MSKEAAIETILAKFPGATDQSKAAFNKLSLTLLQYLANPNKETDKNLTAADKKWLS